MAGLRLGRRESHWQSLPGATARGTQRDSLNLSQGAIPMARRPIPTSESFWRGQDMLYSRPSYVLFHTHRMSPLEASSSKYGRARWAVLVNPGSCQTERRILAGLAGLIRAIPSARKLNVHLEISDAKRENYIRLGILQQDDPCDRRAPKMGNTCRFRNSGHCERLESMVEIPRGVRQNQGRVRSNRSAD